MMEEEGERKRVCVCVRINKKDRARKQSVEKRLGRREMAEQVKSVTFGDGPKNKFDNIAVWETDEGHAKTMDLGEREAGERKFFV
jgi:hypothetical protein